MGLKLIAEGNIGNLSTLGQYESHYAEGDKGEMRLSLSTSVPDWAITGLQSSLELAGVDLWDDVKQSNRITYIRFRKGIGPLAIMAIIIAAAIAIVILLIGWQLFKSTGELGPWGVPVWALVIVGGIAAYLVLRRR